MTGMPQEDNFLNQAALDGALARGHLTNGILYQIRGVTFQMSGNKPVKGPRRLQSFSFRWTRKEKLWTISTQETVYLWTPYAVDIDAGSSAYVFEFEPKGLNFLQYPLTQLGAPGVVYRIDGYVKTLAWSGYLILGSSAAPVSTSAGDRTVRYEEVPSPPTAPPWKSFTWEVPFIWLVMWLLGGR
jgi:hypothetical protein